MWTLFLGHCSRCVSPQVKVAGCMQLPAEGSLSAPHTGVVTRSGESIPLKLASADERMRGGNWWVPCFWQCSQDNSWTGFYTAPRGPQWYWATIALGVISLSFQFSSLAQSCPTLCDPMNCSTPGRPVHHQLPEFTQTHVHQVGDAIQPSHPLLSPFPPAPNHSQH